MANSLAKGKPATFKKGDDGLLHIIFETEADAISKMPQGPSIFERRGNVVVMNTKSEQAEQIRKRWRTPEDE